MDQAALTVVAPIEGAQLGSLRTLLASIDDQVRKHVLTRSAGALLPFGDLEHVHFARFVVLDPPADRPDAPPLLFWSTNYDGSRDHHLRELVALAGDGLERVFSHCEGYKQLSGQLAPRLRSFLETHAVELEAFYVGHRGRSVSQIRNESRLRSELEAALGDSSGRVASDPFEQVLRCVGEREDLRWALSPPDPTRLPLLRKALLLAPLVLGALALFPVAVGLAWLLWIRLLELRESRRRPDYTGPGLLRARDEYHVHKRVLAAEEDLQIQNQMTAVTEVKPGHLRLATLRTVLWGVDLVARIVFDQGALHGIETIHFARWVLVRQGGRWRLVFFSNYDGSWESYLGDFIDRAAPGLTGIWSNCVGFPKSRWLFGSGARREAKFKQYVRSRQIPTQVWYSAYPDLSVTNVNDASDLRRGLQGLAGLEERRAWQRLF